MSKLREFPDWPIEQVMETARMLYALRPFKIDIKSELQWNSLAREAFAFLDKLHKACEEIARQRNLQGAAYRRAETRSAEAEKLPDIVPFDKAILFITRQTRTKRALQNFKKALPRMYRYRGKAPTPRMVNAQTKCWRQTGIPRREVMEFQAAFDNSWPIIKGKRGKAKKRKQWEGDRVSKKLSSTFAKVA